jgi:Skp family chaperone for outer membrane proteins
MDITTLILSLISATVAISVAYIGSNRSFNKRSQDQSATIEIDALKRSLAEQLDNLRIELLNLFHRIGENYTDELATAIIEGNGDVKAMTFAAQTKANKLRKSVRTKMVIVQHAVQNVWSGKNLKQDRVDEITVEVTDFINNMVEENELH